MYFRAALLPDGLSVVIGHVVYEFEDEARARDFFTCLASSDKGTCLSLFSPANLREASRDEFDFGRGIQSQRRA